MIKRFYPNNRLHADQLAEIIYEMFLLDYDIEDVARLLEVWRESDRMIRLFAKFAASKSARDQKLDAFLRDCLLTED